MHLVQFYNLRSLTKSKNGRFVAKIAEMDNATLISEEDRTAGVSEKGRRSFLGHVAL